MRKFFTSIGQNLHAMIERFPVSSALSFLLFFLASYMVIFEPKDSVSKILVRIALTIGFGILFCAFIKVIYERFCKQTRMMSLMIGIVSLMISALVYLPLNHYDTDMYVNMRYAGVMGFLFVLLIYFVDYHADMSSVFSHIFGKTVFNGIASGIIMGGISICISAFYFLLYKFDNVYKAYAVAGLFVLFVIFLNLFLSILPKRVFEFHPSKIFKVIVMYIMLPIYFLLAVVLYAYLAKIAITLQFPSGQINWFASFASLLFIFFVFALGPYREENKIVSFFIKYWGYFMLPIMAVQFWAIQIRLSNYGLTSARYVSVVFNAVALIFVIVSLIKSGKYLKQMFVVVAAVSLLLTVTPLNALDVPIWNQTAILKHTLTKNSMLNGNTVIAKGDISNEDKEKITSAYEYINRSDINKPAIIKDIGTKDFHVIFGFDPVYEDQSDGSSITPASSYISYRNDIQTLDISGYAKLYTTANGKADNLLTLNVNGKDISIDILSFAKQLYAANGNTSQSVPMQLDTADGRLVLTELDLTVDNTNFVSVNYYSGYFLVK